jgi:hypothetical protein
MRSERSALAQRAVTAVALWTATAAAVRPARADVRVLVAADSYLATTPGLSTDNAADVAWSAHLEAKDPARDLIVDWVERESLIGGAPRRELHELAYVERGLAGLELTLGRFRVPGGFWLIADGAGVALRAGRVTAGVFGGSRSFTNGRTDTLLTGSPHLLPLAGASITTRGTVQAAASYTYTADRVTLYRGDGTMASSRQPEQFVDAELATPLGDHGFVTLGANAGSRYLVSYPTAGALVADDPALRNVWFGSQAAYALFDARLGAWRLDTTVAALRTKLGQVDDPALAAISGSFLEGTLRALWHPGRAWRIDGRYRLRLRDDHGRAQRAELAMEWRRGALDVQARVGLDLHHVAMTTAMTAPGFTSSRTLLYRASVGRKTTGSDLAAGVAAVAALGDELAAGPGDDAGDQRAPYTLEARSFGFVRAFSTAGAWFGGLDGELDLHGDGARALLQLGFSR